MDARSIAATAKNGGYLCSAGDYQEKIHEYYFGTGPYQTKVYNGTGKPDRNCQLRYGPNITDWPEMDSLGNNLLIKIISFITDSVTTTDELIPSGETSSFRSNPTGLAEFTLSRKDPSYVGKAKTVRKASLALSSGNDVSEFLPELPGIIKIIKNDPNLNTGEIQLGSAIYANKPGDGSAREQAASCQRVLGGCANIAREYATKRYQSNLINWGILPFIIDDAPVFKNGDYIFIPGIKSAVNNGVKTLKAYVITNSAQPFNVKLPDLNASEKDMLLAGSLINFYKKK